MEQGSFTNYGPLATVSATPWSESVTGSTYVWDDPSTGESTGTLQVNVTDAQDESDGVNYALALCLN